VRKAIKARGQTAKKDHGRADLEIGVMKEIAVKKY
jgi:hypothetical protein